MLLDFFHLRVSWDYEGGAHGVFCASALIFEVLKGGAYGVFLRICACHWDFEEWRFMCFFVHSISPLEAIIHKL